MTSAYKQHTKKKKKMMRVLVIAQMLQDIRKQRETGNHITAKIWDCGTFSPPQAVVELRAAAGSAGGKLLHN